jgi:hypothetical protein
MPPAHPRADRPRLLATLVALGATLMTACGPAAPTSSVSALGSATPGPAASPSPIATATGGSESASPTTNAGPAWAVVRATTLPTRLSRGLGRSVAITIGERIDVIGGLASTGATTGEILAFDPAAAHVGAVGELAVPVHDAAGVVLDGAVMIFGGGSGAPTSVVQRFDPSGVTGVIGNLPTARADLGAVAIGNSAVVLGGGAFGVLPPEVLATEDGVQFRTVATLISAVRYPAVAETGGRIYVIGGEGASGETSDIQRIDLATGEVEVIGLMQNPISHASAMVIGGRIFVVGGRSAGTAQDAIWQVDAVTGASRLVARLPQPASDFSLAVVGRVGYAIGGETDTQVASIVAIVVD